MAAVTALTADAAARQARPKPPTEATAPRDAGEPIMAIVSIKTQQVTFYDADGWIMRAPVSTGTTGRETPAGVFAILEKNKDHRYRGLGEPLGRSSRGGAQHHAHALGLKRFENAGDDGGFAHPRATGEHRDFSGEHGGHGAALRRRQGALGLLFHPGDDRLGIEPAPGHRALPSGGAGWWPPPLRRGKAG